MFREFDQVLSKKEKLVNTVAGVLSYALAILAWHYLQPADLIPVTKQDLINTFCLILVLWSTRFSERTTQRSCQQSPFMCRLKEGALFAGLRTGLLFVAFTALKVTYPGHLFLLLFLMVNLSFGMLCQLGLSRLRSYANRSRYDKKQGIIVGTGEEAADLIKRLKKKPGWNVNILGIITPTVSGRTLNSHLKVSFRGYPVLGSLNDFMQVLSANTVDHVIFAMSPWDMHKIQPQLKHCLEHEIQVQVSGLFFAKNSLVKAHFDELDTLPLLSFSSSRKNDTNILVKEILDRTLATLALLLLLPLMGLVALFIKLNNGTPVFNTQTRIGKNGRIFSLIKFQTFDKLPLKKRIGDWLKKTRLDELPLLVNVLKGEMSFVGPQPPLPAEVNKYNSLQRRRLSVKPGIVCTWLMNDHENLDSDTWMKLDLQYIDTWSLISDARLLLKTMPVVLFQKKK